MSTVSNNLTNNEAAFLAVKIMHLVLIHCPIDRCYVCFYKVAKVLKIYLKFFIILHLNTRNYTSRTICARIRTVKNFQHLNAVSV